MEQKSNKTIVLECYRKIIRDVDLSLVDSYVNDNYIQHSPSIKDGKVGLIEMMTFLKKMPKSAESTLTPIMRVIADGDLVAVHLDVKFMGQRIAVIDMMRLENGKLAEHWDAGQPQIDNPDSPITLTNGSTIIEDSADVGANKALIKSLYGLQEDITKYLTPGFIEHNPVAGLINHVGLGVKVHRVIGEGNFVLSQCEYRDIDSVYAHYSIFKLEDDLISEHWSVRQEIPETMMHSNGIF
jgi:predicted SnoaL-like aldol condensation-catalyzing enzyme